MKNKYDDLLMLNNIRRIREIAKENRERNKRRKMEWFM